MGVEKSNLKPSNASGADEFRKLNISNLVCAATCLFALSLVAGCEPSTKQKLSDKLGEREVSALQDIARDRRCLPLPDIQNVRKAQQVPDQIEFLLRDGSRWVNSTSPLKCKIPQPLTIATNPTKDALCAGDSIRLLQTGSPTLIDMGPCELTRFQRR